MRLGVLALLTAYGEFGPDQSWPRGRYGPYGTGRGNGHGRGAVVRPHRAPANIKSGSSFVPGDGTGCDGTGYSIIHGVNHEDLP